MQYRIYDKQTLIYKDGGYVRSYSIDDDYIVNNNSKVSVVKNNPITQIERRSIMVSGTYEVYAEYVITNVVLLNGAGRVVQFFGNKFIVEIDNGACDFLVTYEMSNSLSIVNVGDIIVLIKDSGPYHKGVITAVDDTALEITYRSDKELFNDNMLNTFVTSFIDDDVEAAGRFGVDIVVAVLKALFVDTADKYKKLPITFVTNGDVLDSNGIPKMLWSWSNDSISIVDWLVELFTLYNLSLSWEIDFNTAEQTLTNRKPRYVCALSAITNSGGIIKDNVAMQKITYTTKDLPDATTCIIIGSESKEILNMSDKNLLDPNAATKETRLEYYPPDSQMFQNSVAEIPDGSSNISGFIRIRTATEDNPRKFTYSQKDGDLRTRYVVGYNNDKKPIAYFTYTPNKTDKVSFTFNTDTFTLIGNNTKEQIKWFRFCYCNDAIEQQIESGDEATAYSPFNIPSVYYLYEKDGVYSISTESDLKDKFRVLPVKTIVTTWNESETDSEGVTPEDAAREKLIPSQFNQSIQIRISADSKMFDFDNAKFGDLYKIINEQGTIDSNYTGRKSTSDSNEVILYFGIGRQNYTDLMQLKLRKNRYTEVYN